jgi:hypothetical protein
MSVKVILQGDGLNYETDTSVIQAAKIIGFLNTQTPLAGEYPAVSAQMLKQDNFLEESKARQASSPREAIIESGAKTNVQKIVVLGSYIIDRDDTEEFGSNELKALFLKAGEPAPRNLARDMRDAVRSGYITSSLDKSDAYIVTNTGKKAISDSFTVNNPQTKRKRKAGSNSSSTAKPKLETEWLKEITVIDQLENFPSYRKMATRSQKALWILQWGKVNDKDKLSGAEIIAIASKLGNNIPRKQVTATFSPYLSKEYVSKSSDGYSILYDGTEYLKSMKE